MANATRLGDTGTVKNINERFHTANLKSWQRWGLVLLGAVIGAVAIQGLLRWLENRRNRQVKVGAVPPIV